jgi:eukaryotic-like serine/threonine-protein kinase
LHHVPLRAALVEALAAAGSADDARRALAEARAWLDARAARFEAGEKRERFLRRVPDNARLLAL